MVIGIDMDDVMERLSDAWIAALNQRYGAKVTREEIKNWDFGCAYPDLTKEQVYGVLSEDWFWKTVKPVDGAAEWIQRIIDDGHEVYVITASYYKSLQSKMENVLFKYFPMIDWGHVIIASNKKMVKCDMLVDDGVHNLIGGDYIKVLVDAPYNRDFPGNSYGMIRVKTWEEIYCVIKRCDEFEEDLCQLLKK